MNSKKDEKKYVQMSPDTVSMLAESVGISGIGNNVCRAVAEDASYRCRELTQICGQLMRHSKRRKLTAEDVQRALKWYEAPLTFGHQEAGHLEQSYVQIQDNPVIQGSRNSCEPFFAPDENLIDLHDYSMNIEAIDNAFVEANREFNQASCEATWLAIEGQSGMLDDHPKNLSPALMQYYSALTGKDLAFKKNFKFCIDICSKFYPYFFNTGVVLSDANAGGEIRKTLIKDVKTNSKIGPLVPLLITFVCNGIQRHNENQMLAKRLLVLIEALFVNPYLNMSPKPYLSHLVTALLSTLITDRSNKEPKNDDFNKDSVKKLYHISYAAQVLKLVLDKWATPINQLKLQTHKALREYLNDPKSSSSSQYGALTALIHLGPQVLIENLLPQMNRYVNQTFILLK